jgi:hypothetical protein
MFFVHMHMMARDVAATFPPTHAVNIPSRAPSALLPPKYIRLVMQTLLRILVHRVAGFIVFSCPVSCKESVRDPRWPHVLICTVVRYLQSRQVDSRLLVCAIVSLMDVHISEDERDQ